MVEDLDEVEYRHAEVALHNAHHATASSVERALTDLREEQLERRLAFLEQIAHNVDVARQRAALRPHPVEDYRAYGGRSFGDRFVEAPLFDYWIERGKIRHREEQLRSNMQQDLPCVYHLANKNPKDFAVERLIIDRRLWANAIGVPASPLIL